MSNLKWNKQSGTGPHPRVAENGFATNATETTEAELEAFRFRGTPLRKSAPPASAVEPAAEAAPRRNTLTSVAPVTSPASPAGEDIRDIRQPGHLPTPRVWAVVVAGVISLPAALWKWIRHDKLFVMPPHELALQYLEESRALMDAGRAREYCSEVSKILRRYIEERFHVHAPQLTTKEFLRELIEAREKMPVSQRALLGDFLQHCDLAKLTGWRCCLPDLKAMHTSALEFVRQTAVTKTDQNKVPATPTTAGHDTPTSKLEKAKTI
jgi:Domain of unknown function (DUF4381)